MLGTHIANDLNVVICLILMRDNEIIKEDFALAEKNFGPDIGGLK